MNKQSKQARIEELGTLIREKRATFDEAIEDAKFFAAGSPLPDNIQQHIQFVTAEFDSLLSLLKQTTTDKDLDFVEARAEELADHRVYVLPIYDLKIEAAEQLDELSSMGVPKESLALIKKWVAKLDEKDVTEAEKRLIMSQLIEDYNYWDSYVDWVLRVTNWMRVGSLSLVVLGLVLSLVLFRNSPVIKFIMAGVSGAALSVLLKIPPVIVYKEVYTLVATCISRIATGAIVSVVGLSLLSSKIINLVFEFSGNKFTIAEGLWGPSGPNPPPSPLVQIILIGIGVLFGFSERLLSSLESTFLGKLSLPERRGGKKASEKGET
jgi:hypothetical protein